MRKTLVLCCILLTILFTSCVEYYYSGSDFYWYDDYRRRDRYDHKYPRIIPGVLNGWYESKGYNRGYRFSASIDDIYRIGMREIMDFNASSVTFYNDIYNYRYYFNKSKTPKYKGYDRYRYDRCFIIYAKLYHHGKIVKDDSNEVCF